MSPAGDIKNIKLSIFSGYLIKDCLQVGTVSTPALVKIPGKAGILVLLVNLEFQEITLSAGSNPAWTSLPTWSCYLTITGRNLKDVLP
jgi:hypothetical protein